MEQALIITILVVGIVTAGVNIRFDRFFTILMLIFLFGVSIYDAISIFLWVILLGAIMILFNNKDKIAKLPKKMKIKMFLYIPVTTLLVSFLGSYLFMLSSEAVLIITLGVLAILYGLRLMFIHFSEKEMAYEEGHPFFEKFCGLVGPWISGFSIGFIGTSLKPLKIPFGVKLGKMNIRKVYLGSTVTTFFAASFAIMWHQILVPSSHPNMDILSAFLLGAGLWTGIHYVFEFTNLFFPKSWRKPFQVLVGIALIIVSVKIFLLA